MTFRIGDPVFSSNGTPGIVEKNDALREKIVIDSDETKVGQQFRFGYLKGLSPESRDELYKVLDQVAEIKDPKEKIAVLQEKVDSLEADDRPIAQRLLSYYKAELAHVITSYNKQPRFYTVPMHRA